MHTVFMEMNDHSSRLPDAQFLCDLWATGLTIIGCCISSNVTHVGGRIVPYFSSMGSLSLMAAPGRKR